MGSVDEDLLAYVAGSLPAPPARALEVGAGGGELARALRARGWEVVAIDPAGEHEVIPVGLADFEDSGDPFDAGLAVLSLHHVEPLDTSCARLAALLRPGAVIVVDEFDLDTFDTRAAAWWLERRREVGSPVELDVESVRAAVRDLHPVVRLREALTEQGFELGPVARGPYLYRWGLGTDLREVELGAIAGGELAATGARFTGRRL